MIELKRILVVRDQTKEEWAEGACNGCALSGWHEDCGVTACGDKNSGQVMQIKEIVCLS